ncbi:unnamed protein product, partial [Hapterophycus canaliculatus]
EGEGGDDSEEDEDDDDDMEEEEQGGLEEDNLREMDSEDDDNDDEDLDEDELEARKAAEYFEDGDGGGDGAGAGGAAGGGGPANGGGGGGGVPFQQLNLSRPLLRAVEAMGYVTPTTVQQRAVPFALAGRWVLGRCTPIDRKDVVICLCFL